MLVDDDVVQYLVAGADMIIMGKPEKVALLRMILLCARARYPLQTDHVSIKGRACRWQHFKMETEISGTAESQTASHDLSRNPTPDF